MTDIDPSPAFHAYGRLYAHVIALEQFMRAALAEHEVASGRYGKLNDAQRAAHSARVMRLTFGQLLDRVAGAFKLTPDERQVLRDAKGFRDHLAHGFWSANLIGLHTSSGISLLVEECAALELQFRLTTDLMLAATKIDTQRYVDWTKSRAADPLFGIRKSEGYSTSVGKLIATRAIYHLSKR